MKQLPVILLTLLTLQWYTSEGKTFILPSDSLSHVRISMLENRSSNGEDNQRKRYDQFLVDADGDGFSVEDGDCDDNDNTTYPGAPEICDYRDNNCDNIVDTIPYFPDADGDGFGNNIDTIRGYVCNPPEGYVPNSTDCDDTDPNSYPGAPEICDGKDNNCDWISDPDFDIDGIPDCQDNCPFRYNAAQVDNDCDEVGDSCDWCPGGDDRIDNNGDGLPDCAVFPGLNNVEVSWLCRANKPERLQRISICRNGRTFCSVVDRFYSEGDTLPFYFLGPCGDANCQEALPDALQFTTAEGPDIVTQGEIRFWYVNPVDDLVQIGFDKSMLANDLLINVYDLIGRSLIQQQHSGFTNDRLALDLSGLNPGNYILMVRTANQQVSVPLVKM